MAQNFVHMREHLRIGGWNILFDPTGDPNIPSQADRLENIASAIASLNREFDFFAVLEAQATNDQHNGKKLAAELGYGEGFWKPHSRKKAGEELGAFGSVVNRVDFVDLSFGKSAGVAHFGEVVGSFTHLNARKKFDHTERIIQVHELLEHLGDHDYGFIILDANCLPDSDPRRAFERAGYESAFRQTGQRQPKTVNTDSRYFHNMSLIERLACSVARGFAVDDIYVKNIPVTQAHVLGEIEGVYRSDHLPTAATLDVAGLLPAGWRAAIDLSKTQRGI